MCNCNKIYNTAAVLCDSGNVNLVIPVDFSTPQNRQRFNFRICQKIPSGGECGKVSIVIAGNKYPLWNKFGSDTFGSELECGRVYCGYYDVGHFITHNAPTVCAK